LTKFVSNWYCLREKPLIHGIHKRDSSPHARVHDSCRWLHLRRQNLDFVACVASLFSHPQWRRETGVEFSTVAAVKVRSIHLLPLWFHNIGNWPWLCIGGGGRKHQGGGQGQWSAGRDNHKTGLVPKDMLANAICRRGDIDDNVSPSTIFALAIARKTGTESLVSTCLNGLENASDILVVAHPSMGCRR